MGGPVCTGNNGWSIVFPDHFEDEETLCDGLDNDCDGDTDEGLLNACDDCRPPSPDVCDGVDNDCDGKTDEDAGEPPPDMECIGGKTGVCKDTQIVCNGEQLWKCVYPVGYEPEETLCDSVDNDCDGQTDETFDVGGSCAVGEGICRVTGAYACSSDKAGLVCAAQIDLGAVELCGDNIDNDCDGQTDEEFPVGETCSVGTGSCKSNGKFFCSEDRLAVSCMAEALDPEDEICSDNADNDCDGKVDESPCLPASPPGGTCSQTRGSPVSTLTFLLLMVMPMGFLALRRRPRTRN